MANKRAGKKGNQFYADITRNFLGKAIRNKTITPRELWEAVRKIIPDAGPRNK
jgi:hypothetical protein